LGYRGSFLNMIPSEYERSLMTIQKKSHHRTERELFEEFKSEHPEED
jgi:hypothetical protein